MNMDGHGLISERNHEKSLNSGCFALETRPNQHFGGDHPKTSQEWSIGATSCCQNHGSTSVDGVPTWLVCLECPMIPMMVSHLHINPEECCDCTCQKLRHGFEKSSFGC